MATSDDHVTELLKLPVDQRAHAARLLLESLDDGPPDEGVAEAQANEIARRLESLANGSARLRDWDEVRERVRAKLEATRKR